MPIISCRKNFYIAVMGQVVNDIGDRARNFYTSSEHVSDGCHGDINLLCCVLDHGNRQ